MDHIVREGPKSSKLSWIFLFGIAGAIGLFVVLVLVAVLAGLIGGFKSVSGGSGNIALIKVEGVIQDSQTVVESLVKYRKNPKVKAILLRVDSPGGAIAPTQEIYDEVKKCVTVKPVVASFGSTAASGGYYLAAPASRIIANPGSVTGSIGVIMKHFIVDDIARKFLLKWEIIKSGANKDLASPLRQLTHDERQMLQEMVAGLHAQFVRHVAEARGLTVEAVGKLATGRIYTGEEAVALKLVDELGNMQKALEVAGKLGGIAGDPKIIKEPDTRPFTERLMDQFVGALSRHAATVDLPLNVLWRAAGLPLVLDRHPQPTMRMRQ